MKKRFSLALCALCLCSLANAAIYDLDKAHSNVNFKVKHLSISNVNGKFSDANAQIDLDNGVINSLSATIKTSSVNTDNDARDNHLQQADFFDSKQYPDMKFVMEKFVKDGENEGKVIGNLTIKNVTKPVTLDYEFGGKAKNMQGKNVIGFSLEGEIKRSDFNFAPSSSNAVLSDKIKINIDVEAVER
ncbi:putative periplasmic protein (YceI-like domain) [Campylobacter iguaniorum]|uniref:YceI family protein n=1 Tax=Campylobacter iguaniorum TaxID=1244531 RepID=UPI0007C94423|nr:YceI family protein [Campylobacter iguaniorum]ANE35522.1 putative periplasmic protein (YceI-like domain) [Campylobacter iguaniorum]